MTFFVAVKWSRVGRLRYDWGYRTRSQHADYASWAYMSGLLLFFTGVTALKAVEKTLFRIGLPGKEGRLVSGLESYIFRILYPSNQNE